MHAQRTITVSNVFTLCLYSCVKTLFVHWMISKNWKCLYFFHVQKTIKLKKSLFFVHTKTLFFVHVQKTINLKKSLFFVHAKTLFFVHTNFVICACKNYDQFEEKFAFCECKNLAFCAWSKKINLKKSLFLCMHKKQSIWLKLMVNFKVY